ncbi:unnamed protein product [Leptosia nina]|uniref:lysoplasmalogenase n=1 Tax=Leptosia nina TaxID=320188 RepID=A0AAV1J1Z7_9NEOP
MISLTNMINCVRENRRLVPFFKAVFIYFALSCEADGPPSAWAAAFKCAPVMCLMACVAGCGYGWYARFVALGLGLSAIGDALLVWPQYFLPGMGAFAVAHIAYILAFGWKPQSYLTLYVIYEGVSLYIQAICPPASLSVLVQGYALLLTTMTWHGIVRKGIQRYGVLLFLISDAILGYSLFRGTVPYKQVIVMSTYYSGQFFIAMSALQRPQSAVVTN